ncbi:MAG TPA: hypothetical protein VJ455_00820 [Ignavibacteria bacterium]|nr:hypothetical protein [Ignavibacteria bacterium]
MNRYLVETSHNREDCLHVLDQFVAYGHITHFEWGCESGVCTGWAFLEAESEEQALLSVPSFIRDKARVIKLSAFTPEKIQHFHEEING